MTTRVVTAATGEPIALQDVKTHIRVSSNDDNDLISNLQTAARDWIETRTRRAFADQRFRRTLDDWPVREEIELPRSPIRNASTGVSVTYFPTTAGSTGVALSSTKWFVDDQREPPLLVLREDEDWPDDDLRDRAGVQVEWDAGYGGSTAVPQVAKQAILLAVGHWYEHRESSIVGPNIQRVPDALDALVWSLKIPDVP